MVKSLSKIPSLFLKYKFNIITVLYYFAIACYPREEIRFVFLLGAISLVFFHNIFAKTKFTLLWVVLFSIIIAFNAYLAYVYSSPVRVGLFAAIIETNVNEATSVLSTAILPILIILTISTTLIYLSVREWKGSSLSRRKSLIIILLYCYGLAPLVFRRILITDLKESYNRSPIYTLHIATNHYSPLVYGNMLTVIAYIKEVITFKEFENTVRVTPGGITFDETNESIDKIFLVIGESATFSKLSLYGYNKPTTAFADSLHRADSTRLFFYDGTSTASFTRFAVPGIVSTAHAGDPTRFYQEKNILDLANEAGYETIWISNQSRIDFWSSEANFIGSIASSAKHNHFSVDGQFTDDFALLGVIDKHFDKENKKQLFVIHLQGSHYHYARKYDEIDEAAVPGDGSLRHMYDLSVHHTDRFLKYIYNNMVMQSNDSGMILYVSDHGEDVGTELGHGLIPISKIQFQVPFVVYNNSQYPIKNVVDRYINLSDSTVSNASSLYVISEALGYSASDERAKQAVEEGRYAKHGDDIIYRVQDIEPYTLNEENM